MRILYLTQYFPPEIGATQTRAYEMAKGLVRAGHSVTVITEVPNHPAGIVPAGYRGKLYDRVEMEGIDVIRMWVKASPVKSFRSRMSFYLSFLLTAVLGGMFLARGKYDVLYATSPPLFAGGAGLILSYLRRVPLILEVRDLWPESAVELGELKNPRAIGLATWLEERCYRRARHLVLATKGIRARLLERGCDSQKMTIITNGANTELYQPRPADPELRRALGIEQDRFVVAYTGLHGLAHGLETVLEAASLLASDSNILFLMVGDGPEKKKLRQLAEERQLKNVQFQPAVPEEELAAYLALADVGLDTRKRIGISTGTLPVKMFSYMACGKPVILAIEGEASILLEEAGAGIVVPPESARELADAILLLQADPKLRDSFGASGRRFVVQHYSRKALAARLEHLLTEQIFNLKRREVYGS